MSDGLLAIIAGLLGSLITVIVTKILDIIQKKSEYKIELKKQFFIKKLQAGETAMIQCTHLSVALQQLSILYVGNDKLQTGFKEHFLEHINSKLEIVNSSSLLLSGSIGLYFDFVNSEYENKIFDILSDKLALLSNATNDANHAYKNYTKMIGHKEEDLFLKNYEVKYADAVFATKSIGILYKQCNDELREQMKHMRNEMKKYE